MVDPSAHAALSAVESSLHDSVQALLKEMSSHSASHKGVLRWSLQKKLDANPSSSVSLISVLVRELDKLMQIHKTQSYMHAIPVLHTLYYVVIQLVRADLEQSLKSLVLLTNHTSGSADQSEHFFNIKSGVTIPISVYQIVYECLMKLLILPSPYSAVALSTLRIIKMEMTTPGSLYQRRVTAEQNLRSEHFTLQEKVFVLADPAVFSAPMEAAVRSHLESSSYLKDTSTMQKNVLLRVLHTGLGTTCQSSTLAQALEALGEQMVEKYFQEVVLAVETSIKSGAGGRANYLNKLQHIYREILTASEEERTKQDHGSRCRTAMPYPEINFLLWRDKKDLWNLLANLAKCPSFDSTGIDEEEKDKRDSVRSDDSGIGRDLKEGECDDTVLSPITNPGTAFTRRNAFKNMKAVDKLSLMKGKVDTFPALKEDMRRHTARVVVMGDDRVLGRLTRAYHAIREKESKKLFLTKKLNLRFYYIPVTDVEPSLSSPNEDRLSLASLLGRVDPWYNSNINSLGAAIAKLPGMQHSKHKEPPQQNPFLLDTLCYYLRCGSQQVNLPLYSVKMTRSCCGVSSVVEEVFVSHLEADIPEFRHLKEKLSKEPKLRQKKSIDVFGSVISVSYKKISLSKREVVKGEAPMTCGVVITSEPAAVTSGKDHLSVKFDSVNKGYNTTIQTQSISIRTLEDRTLSVCLDKDSRRTYTDVQRVEISPCLDPRCSARSKFSVSQERELLLSKYLDKVLSLPINTFTGVTF